MFKSVVKESCFKLSNNNKTSLQRLSGNCRTSLTTNLVFSASFPFKVKPKKLFGQDCLKMGKKISAVFCCKYLRLKISK